MADIKIINQDKTILHLCADIGSDSKPYKEHGYNVICVGQKIGVENFNPPENVYGIIANPPCTMFSIARTKAKTPRDLKEGMRLVKECLRIIWECQYRIEKDSPRQAPLKFWVIENPATGFLRWFLGQPRFEYNQAWYGQSFRKQTALWGQFNIPRIPFMEPCMNQQAGTLGGHYRGNESLCFSRDGGGKAVCPELFAKEFFIANQ